MSKKRKIVCYGELLWDVFPTHKKIGGAPLNVALRLQFLENDVSIISSIGNDPQGTALKSYLEHKKLDTTYIQIHKGYPTGEANVFLDDEGTASYDIKHPCAWDHILMKEALRVLVKHADTFIYGSLAARNERSEQSLFELLRYANYKVFDVNLRPPYYTKERLVHLMQEADIIKFNEDELYEISAYLGIKYDSLEQNIQDISRETHTKHICVTRGKDGAVLFYNSKFYYNSGYTIKVVDTVGSGDSFLASLISVLLNGGLPQYAINYACAVGALVAQHEGANPILLPADINRLTKH